MLGPLLMLLLLRRWCWQEELAMLLLPLLLPWSWSLPLLHLLLPW